MMLASSQETAQQLIGKQTDEVRIVGRKSIHVLKKSTRWQGDMRKLPNQALVEYFNIDIQTQCMISWLTYHAQILFLLNLHSLKNMCQVLPANIWCPQCCFNLQNLPWDWQSIRANYYKTGELPPTWFVKLILPMVAQLK